MSKQTEELMISACIRSGSVLIPNRHGISKHHFKHWEESWEWIVDWNRKHGSPPSEELFSSKFPKFPKRQLQGDPPEVDYLTDKLHSEWVTSRLSDAVKNTIKGLASEDDPEKLKYRLSRDLEDIDFGSSHNEMEVISGWAETYGIQAQRAKRRDERGFSGIPTGIDTIDVTTDGFQPGSMWVVGARTNHGKTLSMVSMASHAAASGWAVQFITLEQPRVEIHNRCLPFLARHAGFDVPKDGLSSYDLVNYKDACKAVEDNIEGQLIIDDTERRKVSIASIVGLIERNEPDVVFVDYLTLMARSRDWMEIAEVSSDLKAVALAYDIPVVAASQLNRNAADGSLATENIGGSDVIGQDADGVVMMHFEPHGSPVMRMSMPKHRNGKGGMIWFIETYPERGIFREVSRDYADELRMEYMEGYEDE